MNPLNVIVLLGLLACATSATLDSLLHKGWNSFKNTHNKIYQNGEESMRMKIFADNNEFIAEHNKLFKLGKKSYTMKMNHYGDLIHNEFAQMMNTFTRNNESASTPILFQGTDDSVPDSVDWRDSNLVTAVKDQGDCGSCWAFSTTGSLEGQYALSKQKLVSSSEQKLVSFSEQNLIDCAYIRYGNYGCRGGLQANGFKYIMEKGIETEKNYPYLAEKHRCQFSEEESITISDFVNVTPGEEALQKAVATIGPISVAIDASARSMQFYSKGVYDEPYCSSEDLDHAVLVVGYGTDEDTDLDYWLVKNSWSSTWGKEGYIQMSRNKDNQCGVASEPNYPVM